MRSQTCRFVLLAEKPLDCWQRSEERALHNLVVDDVVARDENVVHDKIAV